MDLVFESGRIKMMDKAKGFGFIRLFPLEDGSKRPDVFFHAEECANAFEEWTNGTLVEFVLVEAEDEKLRAENVRISLSS